MKKRICEKCQSTEVFDDVRIADRSVEEDWMTAPGLKIEVETKPNARLFKGIVTIPFKAIVCGSCGYTELYVSDPQKLVEARNCHTQRGI